MPVSRSLRSLVFLAVSCLSLALGALNLGAWLMAPDPEPGVRLTEDGAGVRVETLAPGGAAEISGLRPGDRIAAINGAPPRGVLDASDRLWRTDPASPIRLEIERDGGRLTLFFAAARSERELYPRVYLWLVGLAFLVSGTLLMMQRRRAGLAPYFILSLTAWTLLAFSHTGSGSTTDWIVYWLDSAARCLAPALAVHCALLYPRPLASRRARLALTLPLYGAAGVLLAASLWLVAAGGAYRYVDPVSALETLDRAHLLLLAVGLGGAAAILGMHRLRHRDRIALRQLKWVEWGTAAALVPFVLFYLLPASLGFEIGPLNSLALLPLILLPVSCSAALARRRLADLEVLLKRGVVTAANGLAVALCYFFFYIVARSVLRNWGGAPREIPMLLAALAAAVLYPGLRERIHARIDRLFYLDKYDYRKTLVHFSRELNSERESSAVLETFLERVVQTLEVARAALCLRTDGDQFEMRAEHPRTGAAPIPPLRGGSPLAALLQRADSLSLADTEPPAGAGEWTAAGFEHLVPMKVKGQMVAVLAVGPRAGGASLTREDLQLLEAVAGHAAMAIEGARLYEEIRRKVVEVDRLRALSDGIIRASRIGILVVGPEGTIHRANESATELLGGSLAGSAAGAHLPPAVLDLLAAGPGGGDGGIRRLFRLPVGSPRGRRIVNATVAPLSLPEVGPGASMLTLDDVTERVELEEKLIQNERLASIGLLAAGVAHEVNTPLTGISSYIQMLLDDLPADDARAGLLRKVERQVFRASDIVNGLLNFSRGGDQAFHPTDLNAAVEEAIGLFEPHLRNTRILLERDLAPDLPPVRGIRREIQQVVVNLLLNARDAMQRGGTIRVSTRCSGSGVELLIADTGRGIPTEHLHRIYDPFFTTKGVGRGTGLGLSVTYGIVRKHSGSIDVSSAAEQGTVFTISLPAAEEPARAVAH
jgi:signal transduction histidine kinase